MPVVRVNNFLGKWIDLVVRRVWVVICLLSLVTFFLGGFAVQNFRINSDLSELISQDKPWRTDFDRYEKLFPDAVRTSAIVVSGSSYKGVEETALAIEAKLRSDQDSFSAIYAPQNSDFFRDNALLFLDLDDLDDMVDRIARAQPMLGAVQRDPSLRGVFTIVSNGLDEDVPDGFDQTIRLLSVSGRNLLTNQDATISWTDELFDTSEKIYRVISLKGPADFENPLPDAQVVTNLREIVSSLDLPEGVVVRLTGEIPLQHEEIESAVAGVQIAGWLSLILLGLIIVVGIRSFKIALNLFITLLIGLIWTSGYAMASVGEFNTLSIIFLVMFFGIGVDFGLHFSLSYREALCASKIEIKDALKLSAEKVGGAIVLCSLTTSIGFLGFLPTEYQGLADLGVIAAGGMVIAAFLTLTLQPALYSVMGNISRPPSSGNFFDPILNYMISHRRKITYSFVVLSGFVIYFASQIHFDYSVLSLKDDESESMITLRELQDEDLVTDYSLLVVSDKSGDELKLEDLDSVESVTGPYDYVPSDQDEKLLILEDMQQILWGAFNPSDQTKGPSADEIREEIIVLSSAIEEYLEEERNSDLENLGGLLEDISRLPNSKLLLWQEAVLVNLLDERNWLRRAIHRDYISFDDLPMDLRNRLVSSDGQLVTVVNPFGDVSSLPILRDFVESVRAEVPVATGRSVIEWGIGDIVLNAFLEALLYATVSIFIVLLIVFRNFRDPCLIVIPLFMASAFSLAVCVLIGLPINMANVLVLPLVMGLGVDNGIHVVDRFHKEKDIRRLMKSSTPRAVLISTATTLGAFIALSFSPHQGAASVGLLLSIAVSFLLLFTVLFLPLLFTLLDWNKS